MWARAIAEGDAHDQSRHRPSPPPNHTALGQGATVRTQASDQGLHVANLNNAAAHESGRAVVSQLAAISA